MDAEIKKREERRIFDYVYSDRSFNDVRPHENPDFLARHSPASQYFGVEVTEYYVNEASARLDRVRNYRTQLLQGASFKHKDDAKHLSVGQVDIIKVDGSTRAKDVPAIIQAVPSPTDCAPSCESYCREGSAN